MEDEVFLNDVWCLYFHDPDNDSWTKDSYIHLGTIGSVQDFVKIYHSLESHWVNGMFFFMREHILPMWEDKYNSKGGCFSFKLYKEDVQTFWFDAISTILGETFIRDEERETLWNCINGISMVPKKKYWLVRIWISDVQYGSTLEHFQIQVPSYTTILFKPHIEHDDFVSVKD